MPEHSIQWLKRELEARRKDVFSEPENMNHIDIIDFEVFRDFEINNEKQFIH